MPPADLAGYKGAGKAAEASFSWMADLIHTEDTVEKLHAELAGALAVQKTRFLIVIDDIDRLPPDEALLIFRLVKSVGRLPNVVYLLVFGSLTAFVTFQWLLEHVAATKVGTYAYVNPVVAVFLGWLILGE